MSVPEEIMDAGQAAEQKKKQPYLAILAELDPDLLQIAQSLSDEQVDERIAEAAKLFEEFAENEKNDEQLKEEKQKLKDYAAQYTDGKKVNKARVQYLRSILVARGKA